MRCTGCGMNIPFAGEACPHCLREKKSDQAGTIATGAGLLVGGFIGSLIGGFGGMLVGGFVLGLLAAFVSMSGKNHTAKKPPRVRVDGFAPTKPGVKAKQASTAVADAPEPRRLRRLDDLQTQGLISEQQHQDLRKAIISQI